ncbi:hypothetical protein IWX47DRAFT_583723 [Phyllosticta citricarpa]
MSPGASLTGLAFGSLIMLASGYGTNDSLYSGALAVDPLQDPFPYQFPSLQNANSSSLFPMEKCRDIQLEEASIDELQHVMSSGKLTSEELVFCFMRRMQQVDQYISMHPPRSPTFYVVYYDLSQLASLRENIPRQQFQTVNI